MMMIPQTHNQLISAQRRLSIGSFTSNLTPFTETPLPFNPGSAAALAAQRRAHQDNVWGGMGLGDLDAKKRRYKLEHEKKTRPAPLSAPRAGPVKALDFQAFRQQPQQGNTPVASGNSSSSSSSARAVKLKTPRIRKMGASKLKQLKQKPWNHSNQGKQFWRENRPIDLYKTQEELKELSHTLKRDVSMTDYFHEMDVKADRIHSETGQTVRPGTQGFVDHVAGRALSDKRAALTRPAGAVGLSARDARKQQASSNGKPRPQSSSVVSSQQKSSSSKSSGPVKASQTGSFAVQYQPVPVPVQTKASIRNNRARDVQLTRQHDDLLAQWQGQRKIKRKQNNKGILGQHRVTIVSPKKAGRRR